MLRLKSFVFLNLYWEKQNHMADKRAPKEFGFTITKNITDKGHGPRDSLGLPEFGWN